MQAGNLGLLKAARKFDPEVGASFSDYAFSSIWRAMQEQCATMRYPMRLPLRQFQILCGLQGVGRQFRDTNSRDPTPEEWAKAYNERPSIAHRNGERPTHYRITVQDLIHLTTITDSARNPLSERAPVRNDDTRLITSSLFGGSQSIPSAETVFFRQLATNNLPLIFDEAFGMMNARQRRVFALRMPVPYGPHMRHNEIAELEEMGGISRARVQQIDAVAKNILSICLENNDLRFSIDSNMPEGIVGQNEQVAGQNQMLLTELKTVPAWVLGQTQILSAETISSMSEEQRKRLCSALMSLIGTGELSGTNQADTLAEELQIMSLLLEPDGVQLVRQAYLGKSEAWLCEKISGLRSHIEEVCCSSEPSLLPTAMDELDTDGAQPSVLPNMANASKGPTSGVNEVLANVPTNNVSTSTADLTQPTAEELKSIDYLEDPEEVGQLLHETQFTGSAVGDYLHNIGKVALLSPDEVIELAKRIEAGVYAELLLALGIEQTDEKLTAFKDSLTAVYYERLSNPNKISGRDPSPEDRVAFLAQASAIIDEFAQAADAHKISSEAGIKKLPPELVTDLEEVVASGHAAKNHMVEANLRLVIHRAKRLANLSLPLLDIIQEGNLGLMHAVNKYDHTKGVRFSTYAKFWIDLYINRAVDADRAIRLPLEMARSMHTIVSTMHQLETDLKRNPTHEEIAAVIGKSPDWVAQALSHKGVLSLNKTVDNDSGTTYADLILKDTAPGPAEQVSDMIYIEQFRAALDKSPLLTKQERYVANKRFGLSTTAGTRSSLEEIAHVLGSNGQSISNIEKRLIAKLLHPASETRWLLEGMAGYDTYAQRLLANCYDDNSPSNMFLPGALQHQAKLICAGCALAKVCLDDAVSLGIGRQAGVAGGLTDRERRAQLRRDPALVAAAQQRSTVGRLLVGNA